jgi:hypothetical protein
VKATYSSKEDDAPLADLEVLNQQVYHAHSLVARWAT